MSAASHSAPVPESTQRLLTALMRGKGFAAADIAAALEGLTADTAQALLAELKRQ